MSAPALSTRGLDKSFGSLVVAKNIEIALPQGVRYALIGPNGAGKTTLINLMTGMLQPDGGRDPARRRGHHRARRRAARVKRGLVRTFQINTLFPHLTALEAVTLAVCERRRRSRAPGGGQPPHYRDAIDEAYAILELAAARRRSATGRRASSPTASSGCSRSRWRSPPSRRCCCSTSRRPACRATRARELFAAIASLSQDITVLFIEHDMDLVFRFASRIIVHGRRRASWSRARRRRSPPTRACARSISAGHEAWLSRCSRSRTCAPATATRSCSTTSRSKCRSAAASRCSGATASARSTLLLTIMGFTQVAAAASSGAARTSRGCAPHRRARAGIGWVAQEREIFPSLTVEENLTVAARPGRWDLDAVYELFPRLHERRAAKRQPALRRRAADAGDRARADDQSGAAAARRAARRPRADHRRGAGRGASAA